MRPSTLVAFAAVLLATSTASAEPMEQAASGLAKKLLDALGKSDRKESVKAVVVMPLRELGKTAREKKLGAAMAELISGALVKDGRVKVIERSRLDALVKEQKIAVVAGDKADVELGKLAGAEAMIVGELADAGDKILLTARLVHIETATTIAAETARVDIPGGEDAPAPKIYSEGGGIESSSVDMALRRLSDGLAKGFSKLPGNERYQRLAVLDFTESGEKAKQNELGKLVSAELNTMLQRDHGLILVERSKLQDVMKEITLGQAGLVDEKNAPQLGKLVDAQALVIGTINEAGDRFLVNARVVATETGETLAADNTSIPASGLIALSADAVVLRSKSGAAFRSTLIPGWGQFYNREEIKGGAFLAVEAGLMLTALGFHFSGAGLESDYNTKTCARPVAGSASCADAAKALCAADDAECDPVKQAESLRLNAQDRYGTRNLLLLVGAGFWAVNILDAYLSGYGDSFGGGSDVRVVPLVPVNGDGAVGASISGSF